MLPTRKRCCNTVLDSGECINKELKTLKEEYESSVMLHHPPVTTNTTPIATATTTTESNQVHSFLTTLSTSIKDLKQLTALTNTIKNKEFIYLKTIKIDDTLLQFKNQVASSIPERLALRINDMNKCGSIFTQGLLDSQHAIEQRRKYTNTCLLLRKQWRLTIDRPMVIGSSTSVTARDKVTIDCSYVSAGDDLAGLDDFLIPLTVGGGACGVSLGSVIQDRVAPLCTLELKLNYVKDNQYIPLQQSLLWDVESSQHHRSVTANQVGESADEMDEAARSEIRVIEKVCLMTQHDVLCRRIFAIIKEESSVKSRSVFCTAAPLLTALHGAMPMSPPLSDKGSGGEMNRGVGTTFSDDEFYDMLRCDTVFYEHTNLLEVGKTKVTVKLSESLVLSFRIVPLVAAAVTSTHQSSSTASSSSSAAAAGVGAMDTRTSASSNTTLPLIGGGRQSVSAKLAACMSVVQVSIINSYLRRLEGINSLRRSESQGLFVRPVSFSILETTKRIVQMQLSYLCVHNIMKAFQHKGTVGNGSNSRGGDNGCNTSIQRSCFAVADTYGGPETKCISLSNSKGSIMCKVFPCYVDLVWTFPVSVPHHQNNSVKISRLCDFSVSLDKLSDLFLN